MEDNFYQISTEKLFPKSKKKDEKELAAKIAYDKEAPLIAQTIARLEKQIAFYQSVSSIKTEDDPEKFMREVAVNKRIAEILKREAARLKGEVTKYGKRRT